METQRSYTAHHQRCSDDATPGSRRRGLSGNGGWRLLSWSCAHRFDGSSSHQGVGIYRQHGEDNRPHRETRPDFWFVIAPWRRASARGYGRFCWGGTTHQCHRTRSHASGGALLTGRPQAQRLNTWGGASGWHMRSSRQPQAAGRAPTKLGRLCGRENGPRRENSAQARVGFLFLFYFLLSILICKFQIQIRVWGSNSNMHNHKNSSMKMKVYYIYIYIYIYIYLLFI
jgi:hypothetical protein